MKTGYKPGYRTSEFWFTLVSFLFSGLYLLGIIGDNSQKEDLIRDVSHGVESCILIGGQLIILYKYVKGRSNVKQAWWGTMATEIKEEEKKIENDNTSTPTTAKPRSRKTKKSNKRINTKRKKDSPKWSLENITINNSCSCSKDRRYSSKFSWQR